MEDFNLSNDYRNILAQNFNQMLIELMNAADAYNEYLGHYSDSMQKELDKVETYLSSNDLMLLHQKEKKETMEQVTLNLFEK